MSRYIRDKNFDRRIASLYIRERNAVGRMEESPYIRARNIDRRMETRQHAQYSTSAHIEHRIPISKYTTPEHPDRNLDYAFM